MFNSRGYLIIYVLSIYLFVLPFIFFSCTLFCHSFTLVVLFLFYVFCTIQTNPWCAVRSGCNQRNSTGRRLVSMSARRLNQTSWGSSLRLLKRNLDPCNLVTLPQRSGKFCVTLCTALLWLSLGRGPRNHMTGSKPNQL